MSFARVWADLPESVPEAARVFNGNIRLYLTYDTYNTIIFDLGGVLIDWNPKYLYEKVFDDPEKMNWFLAFYFIYFFYVFILFVS